MSATRQKGPRGPKLPGMGHLPRATLPPPDLLLTAGGPAFAAGESALESLLLRQLAADGLPAPATQYRFDPVRQWRFDVAWPALLLAVEVEGGVWHGGRHVRPLGFQRDCEKLNAAAIAGWTVLRYPEKRVRDGSAAKEIAAVLALKMRGRGRA